MHRGGKMRIVRQIRSLFRKMEHSSVMIIKTGFYVCAAAFTAAAVLYVLLSLSDMDYTTGMYWVGQISLFGGRLLLAFTVPVFIAELTYMYRGCK